MKRKPSKPKKSRPPKSRRSAAPISPESLGLFLLVTCEHGGNRVPAKYASLFRGQVALLATHRGYDPGALEYARAMARTFGAELLYSTVTRLLVDLNRSPHNHRGRLSEFTRDLAGEPLIELHDVHYFPHWEQVDTIVRREIASSLRVVHVSCHTFTPELNGQVRNADVGLLFDPQRPLEKKLCLAWQQALEQKRPDLAIRRNYPYLGTSDALVTSMRSQHAAEHYLGIEVELNQKWPLTNGPPWKRLYRDVITTLGNVLPTLGQ